MSSSSISVINHQRVLYLIRMNGPLSRAALSRRANLTKATISKIVEDLEKQNLIREVGLEAAGRGRPSLLYEFNPESAVSIGAEILLDEVQAVVTQMDARPLRSFSSPLPDTKPETVARVLKEIAAGIQAEFKNEILGMGVGLPGICDEQQRVLRFSERLNWRNVPLAEMLESVTGLSVVVENRANAAALGERWYGAGKDADDFIYIHIGTGIKAGIILNGELYLGNDGGAGEIGHTVIVPDGPPCVCGNRGCLEALASTIAIRERVLSLVQAGRGESLAQRFGDPAALTMNQLIEAAVQGDALVNGVFTEAARYIGLAVAGLVNLLNPQKIILGPLATQAPPEFLQAICAAVKSYSFEMSSARIEIVPTELGAQAVAIGSAALLLERNLRSMQYSAAVPEDYAGV